MEGVACLRGHVFALSWNAIILGVVFLTGLDDTGPPEKCVNIFVSSACLKAPQRELHIMALRKSKGLLI